MKVIIKKIFIALMITFILSGISFSSNEKILTEKRVREIVIDVIKKNPQIIYEVLSKYIQEQGEKEQLKEALNHRVSGIPIYPYNPTIGPKNAPITIIEFTDFQCPFCKRASNTIDKLMKIYSGKIRLVFRNLPLSSIHKESFAAARAAMAAHRQGMFWPYHDMLFDNSPNLNKELYIKIAHSLGLDMKRFQLDMKSKEIYEQIKTDIKTAKRFGIDATPTFVINGVLVKGAKPIRYFKIIIDKLLKETHN